MQSFRHVMQRVHSFIRQKSVCRSGVRQRPPKAARGDKALAAAMFFMGPPHSFVSRGCWEKLLAFLSPLHPRLAASNRDVESRFLLSALAPTVVPLSLIVFVKSGLGHFGLFLFFFLQKAKGTYIPFTKRKIMMWNQWWPLMMNFIMVPKLWCSDSTICKPPLEPCGPGLMYCVMDCAWGNNILNA